MSHERRFMMNFADAMRDESSVTRTENGAYARNTSGNACLDLFSTIGSLRMADSTRVDRLFADAYKEDALLATRIVFYGRDVKDGLGERATFREIIRYMAENHPEALRANLDLIGFYGRYDDLYSLIGTPLEDAMWTAMKKQFEEDWQNYGEGNAVSLLGKWIKNGNNKNKKSRELGILTAQKLGYSVYDFKRMVSKLRARIGVVESLMSTGRWDEIKYSAVPSRAMKLYKGAFFEHDQVRFHEFLNRVAAGEEKINSSTLYPYDIIRDMLNHMYDGSENSIEVKTLQAQWNALPNYVDGEKNVIVMADTSGSMYCNNGMPLYSSIGLAIYFAERNRGAYHGMWMNFSSNCSFQRLRGETLYQEIKSMNMRNWGSTTNLEKAFDEVLKVAISNRISPDEMPASIIVISDMEIDEASIDGWGFYNLMKRKYAEAGYDIPNVVFWNVNSRSDVYHADSERKGVQLVSGSSANTFKFLMECIGLTPVECMLKIINSDRYEPIRIDK